MSLLGAWISLPSRSLTQDWFFFLMFAVALSHFPRGLSEDLQEVAGTKLYYFTALIISVFCISAFFFPICITCS